MAKKMKKALCAVLAVIMAFSCFSLTVAAYTGYDHSGTNTSLKVRSEVSVDASSYSVGSTVTATIKLDHPDNDAIGWIGTVAFDDSVLEYKSATLGDGFEYFDYTSGKVTESFVPVAENKDVSTLTAGYGGSAYTMTSLCRLLGTPAFADSHLSLLPVAVISEGKTKGTSTVITLTFEAKATTSATAMSLLPSYVFSSDHGYYDCAAPVEDDGAYLTAYSAIKTPTQFAITGGGGETYYDITFTWHGGSAVKNTKQGSMPEIPTEVPASWTTDDDNYVHYYEGNWSPAVVAATSATTYEAVYRDQFVPASFTDYNTIKANAIAKRDNGTVWTDETLAVLNAALAVDVSAKGKSTADQADVNAAAAAIQDAADNLIEKQATVYQITFNVNGTPTVVSTTEGARPQAPNVPSYQDNEKTYTFSAWKDDVTGTEYTTATLPAATGVASYTAQYTWVYREYPVTFSWRGGSTTVNTHWGVAPVAPTNIPSYEEGGKTYTHNGWNPAISAYDGTVTSYEATYSSEAIIYDIIFIVNGTEQHVSTAAGAIPQAPEVSGYSEGDYDYTPDGWEPALAPASANGTTYTAKYKETFVPADYTAVNAAIAQAGQINRDIYTADSLADLDAAILAADVEHPLGRTQKTTVDGFATAIVNAIGALVEKPADYTAYNNAKSALETELAKTDAYTPDSIATVSGLLADIDNALDKNLKITSQSVVEKAAQDVTALQAQLVAKADKSILKSLIDDAEALDPNKYVDFSGVTSALATANDVYNNDNATDQQVVDATNALRNALSALVFKGADYTAWNALINSFNNIDTNYYTPESVAAVNAVIDQVKLDQDINYQDTLDALCSDLETAINNLQLIRTWEGETDWEGVSHETFGSNLIFTQKVNPDDATDIEVEVKINHPNYDISMLQIAALYDAKAMTFVSADIKNGTEIYTQTKAADFAPADYSLPAMANASILKIAADFDTALAATNATEDLVMVLKFKATGAVPASYIKSVPLQSNEVVTDGESVFSQILTSEGSKEWMHNDVANLVLAEGAGGTVTGTFTCMANNKENVTLTLTDGTNSYSVIKTGNKPDYTFLDVVPGTYRIEMTANGSLGFKVYNVVVEAGGVVQVPSVQLIFGNYDNDNEITIFDIASIIPNVYNFTYEAQADFDGSGDIDIMDAAGTVPYMLTNSGTQELYL